MKTETGDRHTHTHTYIPDRHASKIGTHQTHTMPILKHKHAYKAKDREIFIYI